MVLLDDVDDLLVEAVLEREIDAFFDMRDDDERAHGRGEIVVWIALEVHVLGEIFRLHQFANVVEIGTNTTKRRVGADFFGGCLSQIRHDQTVMIGARRFDSHSAEQRMIKIRQFQPGNVSRNLKEMLEHRQRATNQHGGDDSVAQGECTLQSDHAPIVVHGREEIDRTNHAEAE